MSEPQLPRVVVNRSHQRQRLHRHGESRLILFLSGELVETSFGNTGRFVRGDLLFRPAFYAHADRAGGFGSRYIHLPVSSAGVRAYAKNRNWIPARGRVAIDVLPLKSFLSSPLSGDRLLESLSDDAYTAPPANTPLVRASHRLAAEHDVRIADLSESLEICPYAFTRTFAREFGMTPRSYRRQARLQRAMSLLAADGCSLSQIAAASGHFDQSHLTRNLKRETGFTPLEFRIAAGLR